MCSLINKQLLLTAYAYLFTMEQQEGQQGSEALQVEKSSHQQQARLKWKESGPERIIPECESDSRSGMGRSWSKFKLGEFCLAKISNEREDPCKSFSNGKEKFGGAWNLWGPEDLFISWPEQDLWTTQTLAPKLQLGDEDVAPPDKKSQKTGKIALVQGKLKVLNPITLFEDYPLGEFMLCRVPDDYRGEGTNADGAAGGDCVAQLMEALASS